MKTFYILLLSLAGQALATVMARQDANAPGVSPINNGAPDPTPAKNRTCFNKCKDDAIAKDPNADSPIGIYPDLATVCYNQCVCSDRCGAPPGQEAVNTLPISSGSCHQSCVKSLQQFRDPNDPTFSDISVANMCDRVCLCSHSCGATELCQKPPGGGKF